MEPGKLTVSDGAEIHYYRWLPEGEVRGAVQIAHGMGEHAGRYDALAARLNREGYAVYGNDHRGHGLTAGADRLGIFGRGGWDRVIQDARELNDHVASQHPRVPRVLLGHSMGAMLTQQYIARHGDTIHAAVISGSPGLGSAFGLWLSQAMARLEHWRHGDVVTEQMQERVFSAPNASFEHPEATGFEWLSRDREEVRKYVEDPYCGFVVSAGSLSALLGGAREARRSRTIGNIPADLPIYVFSGSDDPVHGNERGLSNLLERYRSRLHRVDYRLYPEGRHEMLNEVNRNEVVDDLVAWLNERMDPDQS